MATPRLSARSLETEEAGWDGVLHPREESAAVSLTGGIPEPEAAPEFGALPDCGVVPPPRFPEPDGGADDLDGEPDDGLDDEPDVEPGVGDDDPEDPDVPGEPDPGEAGDLVEPDEPGDPDDPGGSLSGSILGRSVLVSSVRGISAVASSRLCLGDEAGTGCFGLPFDDDPRSADVEPEPEPGD